MSAVLRCSSAIAILACAAWARAGDPPVHYKTVGDVEVQIVKVSDATKGGGTIAVRTNQVVLSNHSGRRAQGREVKHEYELTLTPEAVVRWHKLPKVYGADGKPRQHTAEEWRELRSGPTGQPGYAAKFSDLEVDQHVILHLVQPRGASAHPPKPKKGEPPAEAAENLPLVARIVILNEVKSNPNAKPPEKKK